MAIAFASAVYIRFYSGLIPIHDAPLWPAYFGYFVASACVWSLLEARYGLAERSHSERSLVAWGWQLVKLDILTLAVVSSGAFFWRGYSFSRYTVAIFWALHVLLCTAGVYAVRWWLRQRRERLLVLLIGPGVTEESLRSEGLLGAGTAAEFRQCADIPASMRVVDRLQMESPYEEVLAAVAACVPGELSSLSTSLERLPVPASLAIAGLPATPTHVGRSFVLIGIGPQAAAAFDYIIAKRVFDVAVSATLLVLMAPLLLLIAVITRVRTGAPVLFHQDRVGRGGRRFRLYKFRTLPVASLQQSDECWAVESVDAWGSLLRSTGIDELPQLVNVIKGEMSLVGPRPERPKFVEQFRQQLPFYATRHRFQTGITGGAQVKGWRGDTSIRARVEHDLYYLQNWSLTLDMRILGMTFVHFLRSLKQSCFAAERRHVRSV
jgi:lipopolysaccharide/colanic/teichoic acid biosynthesis glycosyltransferase